MHKNANAPIGPPHDSDRDPWRLGLCRRRAAAPDFRPPGAARRAPVRRQQGRTGGSGRFTRTSPRPFRTRRSRSSKSRALDDVDLVFAALPHGHSQQLAGAILDAGIPFVDLGADFRLDDAATYERWYGEAHQAPELLGRFVYGIPELNRAAIRDSKAVAAAGCYATAAILALKPLVDAGLVKPDSIIVDAASGVSGAGRELKESTAFNTVDGSFAAYGLLNHRHTAEMEMALGGNGAVHAPSRADDPRHPRHLLRRGDRQVGPARTLLARLMRTSRSFTSPPIRPRPNGSAGSNGARLTARYDARTGRVLAIAAIDNLGKGAAGQMIQCANLMLGLDETCRAHHGRSVSMSVTAAEGFVAAGCHAGIKKRRFDMALLATDDGRPVPCAAVFTQNKFVAPPVELDRATFAANGGQAAAVIVNSGNANAGHRRRPATRMRS